MIEYHSIPQGSPEWHAMRREHIGSSDAAVLMGCGYMSEAKLFDNKLGLYEVPDNPAMRRGRALEDEARQLYNPNAKPAVVTNPKYPWAMASLDGITDNGRVVEIKTGGEKTEAKIRAGIIPDNHYAQCQHILMITEHLVMDYVFYTGSELIPHHIHRDDEYIKELIEKEKAFHARLMSFNPPEPEIVETDDDELLAMLQEYKFQAHLIKVEQLKLENLKTMIILKCGNKSVKAGGIVCCRQERKGNVDYKSIPELQGVDLEKYRKEGQTIWTIRAE